MGGAASGLSPALLSRLDHIIFATPASISASTPLEKRLGVRATRGGQHVGHGTWNAVVAAPSVEAGRCRVLHRMYPTHEANETGSFQHLSFHHLSQIKAALSTGQRMATA